MNTPCIHFNRSEKKVLADTGVYVMHGDVPREFPMHTHDYYEAFVIISGSATHVLNDQEYELNRGDVFTIMGDQAHAFIRANNMHIVNLEYDPGFFGQPYSEIRSIPGFDPLFLVEPSIRYRRSFSPILTLDEASVNYVVMLADFIIELQKRNDEALYPVIRMNFTALMSYLATQYDANRGTATQVSALSRALAYMEMNISRPIRVTEIAESVFLSHRQLERLFNEYYGESPMKYLQRMRMKNALTLLVRQNESVAAAARQSGFEDVSYFTRVFRMTYGITPSAARKHISKI